MGEKHIDFKKEISVTNEHGEFIQEEETLASIANEDDIMFDLEPDLKSHELNSTEDQDEQQWIPDEKFRLFYAYFKDLASESLFTRREEIEVSAKIKKCEARAGEIKVILDKLLKEKDAKSSRNGHRNGREKGISKQIKIFNAFMKVYSKTAKRLKDRYVKANLRLVLSIVRKYMGLGLPISDLIQEGNIGLMKAVDRFDHTKGFKFSTYASWWIHQATGRSLKEQTRTVKVPTYLSELTSKVYKVISMLHKEMGRKPRPEEIAEKLEISVNYVQRLLNAEKDIISLDSPVPDSEETTFLDFIVDEAILAPDSLTDKPALKGEIRKALTLLAPREEEIIRLRFGIDREDRFTLEEVGEKFGVTGERIRQIEKAALEKLAKSNMREILERFRE